MMNKLLFIVPLLAFVANLFSQVDGQFERLSIQVAEVEKATDTVPMVAYKTAIEDNVGKTIESYPLEYANDSLISCDVHPFMGGLHYAFAQHRTFCISPDMIWLLIMQGAGIHIGLNEEELRDSLVGFKNTKTLTVVENSFVKGKESNDWSSVISKYVDGISQHTTDDLAGVFIPSFSTTSQKETVAFSVAFMSAMNEYFEYELETYCGIPEIIIEGNIEDWIWIYENIDMLDRLKLTDWKEQLKPILQEFVLAKEGTINKRFWQSIYMLERGCPDSHITGWASKFFPYIKGNNWLIKNPSLKNTQYSFYELDINNIPVGYNYSDLNWTYFDGEKFKQYKIELGSGFIGLGQNENLELKPEIAWYVIDKTAPSSLLLASATDTVMQYDFSDDEDEESVEPAITIFEKVKCRKTNQDFSERIFDVASLQKMSNDTINYYLPLFYSDDFSSPQKSINYLKSQIKGKIVKKQGVKVEFIVNKFGTLHIIKIDASKKNTKIIRTIFENIPKIYPAMLYVEKINLKMSLEIEP